MQDAAAEDAVAQSAAAVDGFTTVGKPTKTIETPWGPREVYDPAQDEEVSLAFKRLYSKGNEVADAKTSDDAILIYSARDKKIRSYLRAGCSRVFSKECGVVWALDQAKLDQCRSAGQSNCRESASKRIGQAPCSTYIPWSDQASDKSKLIDVGEIGFASQSVVISPQAFVPFIDPMLLSEKSAFSDFANVEQQELMGWYFKLQCQWE